MSIEESITEALERLKAEGYNENFTLQSDCLECWQGTFQIFEDEFMVDRYFYFDEVVVYAIHSEKFQMKGVLINQNGVFPENIQRNLIQKLKI